MSIDSSNNKKGTIQMAMQFTSVKDALPQKECWCVVWMSRFPSNSVRDRSIGDWSTGGYAFAKFRPTHSAQWSVETCGECVEYWMELPEDPSK